MIGVAGPVPEGAVILYGRGLEVVAYAIRVTQQARVRNGLPRSAELDGLAAVLAAPGQSDSSPTVEEQADLMTINEAATALQVSERTARRLAPRLGGRMVAGRWLLDRQAVAEHNGGDHAQDN